MSRISLPHTAQLEPESRRFESQGLELHYLDWGNESADCLILLHGGLDHARSWNRLARALAREWHVVALDLRGHGDSAHSPDHAYSLALYTYDLAEFVARQTSPPINIVAHSLGAAIALHYAGLFPHKVRRVVAIEGLGFAPPSGAPSPGLSQLPAGPRTREWIADRRQMMQQESRTYPTLESAMDRMRTQLPFLDDDLVSQLVIDGIRSTPDGGYRWKYDPLVQSILPCEYTPEQIHEVWRLIECPTLLCCGSASWATNPANDGRAENFANAEVLIFEGAGHWLHHEQGARFLQSVRTFLNA